MTTPETVTMINRRQKRMGPAPFASFEDLSDELESPDDKIVSAGSVVRLPGIREDATPGTTPLDQPSPQFIYNTGISLVGAACAPPASTDIMLSRLCVQPSATPRIDISRASSSSHHDSRDSTPERELFDVGQDPASAKLGIGFREEGTLDLRSSTEELDFHDANDKQKGSKVVRTQSPLNIGGLNGNHDDTTTNNHHQRKDSQSSDIGLLSISGRTSRLSSIGSQGSGHSRLSNASHLSVVSGQSGLSRSPSPHKMLLETSFCGPKTRQEHNTPSHTERIEGVKIETEMLEKVLLSRKLDPTEAILAEGINVSNGKVPPEKPIRKLDSSRRVVQSVKSDITIKVDEPAATVGNNNNSNNNVLSKTIVSKSGVEYIYIPLKGPLPIDNNTTSNLVAPSTSKTRHRDVKSAPSTITSKPQSKLNVTGKSKSATPSPTVEKKDHEPKYIRIKLKPDFMYSEDSNKQKPDTLNLSRQIKKPEVVETVVAKQQPSSSTSGATTGGKLSWTSTPTASPKPSRRNIIKDVNNIESKTPSPSLSRRSSFASLFRSKEAIMSPDSPTNALPSSTSIGGCRRKNTLTGMLKKDGERPRSRSKSRERSTLSAAPSSTESIDSTKSKQNKSVFSLFKTRKGSDRTRSESSSSDQAAPVLPNIDGIAKVEFKFNDNLTTKKKKYYETPLEGDSIRIPLHSPTHDYEFKTSISQDSQDTVIEATTNNSQRHVEASVVVEAVPHEIEKHAIRQQASTSSDNVVFSTNLGSNNELFSTKLPKDNKDNVKKEIETVPAINGPDEKIDLELATELKCIEPEVIVELPPNNDSVKITIKQSPTTTDNRNSVISSSAAEDDRNSSESERESETDFPQTKAKDLKLDLDLLEPERKGLVLQDSFEDELPYIPTTLPLERSAAIPIVPIKQRSTYEMKTCPIDRPRSTTPINPSCLEEYCEEVMGNFNVDQVTQTIEKMKISLPRHDSVDKSLVKSPRKTTNNTNWFDFAERGIISSGRRPSLTQENDVATPPPLPPKGVQKEWINFEEIPERRRPPKRIQTLPSRGHIDSSQEANLHHDNVVYNYVNPDECKCECHEITAREREKQRGIPAEDELPLLADDDEKVIIAGGETVERIKLDAVVALSDRRSLVSDSSVDLSTNVEQPEANGLDLSLGTPFTSDLGLSSNRSSIVSQLFSG